MRQDILREDMPRHGTGLPPIAGWTEAERFAALESYQILDTPREQDFDDLAQIASQVCGTPIAVVNLVGTTRQWFKAEVGLGVRETPLETSFCGQAILAADMLIIPDATKDSRFDCNPLVTGAPGLRFYAGALLTTPSGLPIGTMCVLDFRPRQLDEHQIRTLKLLARQAMTQLELRKSLAEKEAAIREQEATAEQQRLLTFELKHRMKNMLAMVQAIANQTIRSGVTVEDARSTFAARLGALSNAQDILTQMTWTRASVRDVVQSALSPHGVNGGRFLIEGPDIGLSSRCSLGLSLALHELATNAAKYGALSNELGVVEITWSIDRSGSSPEFHFQWAERSGPPVSPPTRQGFGSRIIERFLGDYFRGTATLSYAPTGVVLSLRAPLSALSDAEG
ncbi:two-component sensor histidine kinase [Ancylobacter aquaticus]|uniref:histidine kinase n=1 Tax=Ancylobacter aquaticus TaxID=100 RepID=A0A4R1I9I1_ANCAQ|nr:HWE histidine kinase domain-containing protein [Ancylobacter aquaticus]TCK30565.1 two-component sensor histidine kinase [Ancylobacter aquaticus]